MQGFGAEALCRFGRALWVLLEVEVGLDRVDAAHAVSLGRAVEHALVVGEHQPEVGPARVLPKPESL